MPFRVTARTVLQLGEELISTDAVAFYELIKNAFDARSKRVEINVVVRLPFPVYSAVLSALTASSNKIPRKLKEEVRNHLDVDAPGSRDFAEAVEAADTSEEFKRVLGEANYIDINDTGHGMTLNDLDAIYLTIGTPHKILQARETKSTSANDGC